ncbi:MAG: MBL fold metallo-hydrolase [Patescibacteria group bacterium]|jgi:L-ascorbate metabolism protein UlaG (beta-lactamase superfamily)
MNITWLGQACFKIQGKDATIIIDPFDANIGLKVPRLAGDLLLITHDHNDHNNRKGVGGDPFIIDGPGEYEVRNVFVYGVPGFHDTKQGSDTGVVTMYAIEFEGLTVAHLGDIGTPELTPKQLEKLEDVDILMIPIGGVYTVDAKGAAKIISQIEPRIVIPMHYYIPGLKTPKRLETEDAFRREMGSKTEVIDTLRITKKDIPQEETRVIFLKP